MSFTLGGSDANRIMNDRAMEVFEEKTGRSQPANLSQVLPVQIGIATEDLNARWYQEHANMTKGVELIPNDPAAFRSIFDTSQIVTGTRPGQLGIRHPNHPYIVGHFDGIIVRKQATASIPIAIFEAKHTSAIAKWNPPEAVVKRNLWQCLLYMMIAEVKHCEMSVFYGNKEWEIHNLSLADYNDESTLLMSRIHEMYQAILNDAPLSDWNDPIPTVVKLTNEKRSYSFDDIQNTNWYPDWQEAETAFLEHINGSQQFNAAEKKLKGLVPDDANKVEGALVTISINRANRKTLKVNADG